jgi:hypothetical protein
LVAFFVRQHLKVRLDFLHSTLALGVPCGT